jgi:hypothetical protein
MAEIALMICAVSSLSASVGGGFYLFKKEQENTAKEELIAEKKAVDCCHWVFWNVIIKGKTV